ncbi:probable WRKY transcription factor 13 isoform X2 [Amaranthus tricolor]|uniref:probable WRKY transcription factor 13 isoform X2 n=1 Tax=Amaranthus tricolor TaxID=29722 RepID=UPI0025845983|nr:probable WRKY transcription factor 13 isoform X2 [Amaranthus tricolor]
MLNQGLMEDHHQLGGMSSSQMMGFYLNSTNLVNYAPLFNHNHNHDQQHQYNDLKPFNTLPSSFALDHVTSTLTQALLSSTNPKSIEQDYSSSSFTNLPPLFSIQKPTPNYNLWSWGEGKQFQLGGSKRSCGGGNSVPGVSTLKMKKMKARRKVREPRFCFKTMSDVDVLDDGYKWRKYGQKVVKNTLHPRSYYRCTQDNCRVKKRVERLAEDPRMVITTYEGRHIHTPSNDDDSHGGQPQLNNFFW